MASPRSIGKHALVFAGSLALGIVAGWSAIGAQIDRAAYDFFLRLDPPPAGSSQAVILAIDEPSLEAFGGLLQLREPLARGLNAIARHEPAAVAIDIVLAEQGTEAANRRLEDALAATPNVVLAAHLQSGAQSGAGPGAGTDTGLASGRGWQEPIEPFRRQAAALGHVHADPDDDGVCRRILLAKAAGSTRHWAMALEALRLANGGQTVVETESALELGSLTVPARHREGRAVRIRYAGPEAPIERLSLAEVIRNPEAAARVRGRVVFVGVVVPGGPDQFLMTPYSYGQAMSGVEINANAYETLARGAFLVSASDSLVVLIAALFAFALSANFIVLGGRQAIAGAVALLVSAHFVPLGFFFGGQVLALAPLAATAWFGFLGGGGLHYLGVRRSLQRAETERSRYQRAVHYVTHEMRTPLTTIQGSSELISRYELSEEKRKEIADLIHSESVRLGRMVEMFLSVERLAAGEVKLERGDVPAGEMLEVCLERATATARRKHIHLDRRLEPDAMIRGDREFLEYACYNLVTNAIKYSPARTTITVRAWKENGSVRISVADRGYGIDKADLKNIFRRFYRTPQAHESGENGSGIGLAIVEEIVVRHGGSIEVESQVGEGSRFTLSLPAASLRETASEAPAL